MLVYFKPEIALVLSQILLPRFVQALTVVKPEITGIAPVP
jgi:hypothetical protein